RLHHLNLLVGYVGAQNPAAAELGHLNGMDPHPASCPDDENLIARADLPLFAAGMKGRGDRIRRDCGIEVGATFRNRAEAQRGQDEVSSTAAVGRHSQVALEILAEGFAPASTKRTGLAAEIEVTRYAVAYLDRPYLPAHLDDLSGDLVARDARIGGDQAG